jgi:hypothetical protein
VEKLLGDAAAAPEDNRRDRTDAPPTSSRPRR